jgi:trehalose/maltose hydrolase-like predicted phosphorylase
MEPMSAAAHPPAGSDPDLPVDLGRRFEAAIVEWNAQPTDRFVPRTVVEELCGLGFDLAVMTETEIAEIDDQLIARPNGPGRHLLCVGGGEAVHEATAKGIEPLDGSRACTDRAAWVRWLLADLSAHGTDPGSVLILVGPDVDVRLVLRVLCDQLHRRRHGELPHLAPSPEWSLTVHGFDAGFEQVHESQLTLADGLVGTRGAPLAGNGATAPRVFHAGVYTGTGPASGPAVLPLWSRLVWSRLDQGHGSHPSRRTLDLRTGFLFEEGPLRSLRFSSLARPATVVLRVNGDDALLPPAGRHTERAAVSLAVSDVRGDGVFSRFGAYDPDPSSAEAAVVAAEHAGFERLLREHREAWARRWQEADIVIDGDPELQASVRFALHHLMASVADTGEAAVGARGLSGPAYHGHVFWDSDVFVLPFLAATHPAAARAMLEYRVRRLPAARTLARTLGRAGARFPWESAADGDDVTPTQGRLVTGDVVPVRTGQMEEHIVADVAWAAACYLDWTGDPAFCAGAGRDLLVETARYWASRVRTDREGRAHIEGVLGPDEYHEMVDDNAFTNVMARWNLRHASTLDGVAEPERTLWRAVAEALVDGYDPRTRIYEQFAGFLGLEPILISELAPRRPVAADVLLGPERTARAQVIKQADVLMLYHLVPDEVATGALAANLDFYEPRTAHGSSLSPAIHAALLARVRRYDVALHWLHIAARIDLDDLTGSTAGGLHLATMGGLWQALVAGFAGVRPCRDRLLVDPRLPPQWRGLHVCLQYRGIPFRLHIGPGSVTIDSDALQVRRVGERWEVVAG